MEQTEPRNKPAPNGQVTPDKGGKKIQWAKNSLFNKWCWENWTCMCKKWNVTDNLLITYTNINSKDKLMSQSNKNPRRKHRQWNLGHFSRWYFLLLSLFRQEKQKNIINTWEYIKLGTFCTAKQPLQNERQPTEWETIFANYIWFICNIYKELKTSTSKNPQANQFKMTKGPE